MATTNDVAAVRQFLGLASYYRRYIKYFADIAAPLNKLTQKGIQFQWLNECSAAFRKLKDHLVQATIRHFQLTTDHAPLQWLSAQKMEGMLCRWALALQEYDFKIVYRKGSANANANALSRCVRDECALTLAAPQYSPTELQKAQQNDEILVRVREARLHSEDPPQGPEWRQHPLRRYRQLWSQLRISDHVLCRVYARSNCRLHHGPDTSYETTTASSNPKSQCSNCSTSRS